MIQAASHVISQRVVIHTILHHQTAVVKHTKYQPAFTITIEIK